MRKKTKEKKTKWLVKQNLIEECAAIKWQQLPRGADGPAANLFVYKKAPLNALALSKPKPCQQGLVDTSLASTFLHKFNVATTGMVKDDVANQCSFELDYMPGSQCASKREGGGDTKRDLHLN